MADQEMQARVRSAVENWVHQEARLIDDGKLEEWLTLFAPGGIYSLPIDENAEPGTVASLIYDDELRRRERVFRLLHTRAHAQDPLSQTMHLVGNVQVEIHADESVTAYSNQIIYEIRAGRADYRQAGLGEQRSFAARCVHRLVGTPGHWTMALKKMVLLNREIAIENLTFIL